MNNQEARARRAEHALDSAIKEAGITLYQAEARLASADADGLTVKGVTIRVPKDHGEDYLVTFRARVDGTDCVAFHGAMSFAEAVTGALRRLYNRSLKWREDEYSDSNRSA